MSETCNAAMSGKKLSMQSNPGRGVPSYIINFGVSDGSVLLNISSSDTTPRRTQHGLFSESEFEMCGELDDVGRGEVGERRRWSASLRRRWLWRARKAAAAATHAEKKKEQTEPEKKKEIEPAVLSFFKAQQWSVHGRHKNVLNMAWPNRYCRSLITNIAQPNNISNEKFSTTSVITSTIIIWVNGLKIW